MQHVFHARQIHSLLTSQELNHANPPDIVFGVAPAVRSRSLWLDQILALVNHQGAGMEAEDLAGDTGGENRPPGGNRRHPLSFSHITPARSIPRPRIPRNFILTISLIADWRKPLTSRLQMCRACRVQ